MRILLTGGGTGGHTAPILAVVSQVKKAAQIGKTVEFLLITPDEYFMGALEREGIRVEKIQAGKLRRYADFRNLTDIFKIIYGTIQSFFIIKRFKPDVVFSKGGFSSVPPVFASWILKVPVVTHESDITPGLANKINAFFAQKILVSFPETQKFFKEGKTVFTGNPVREDIAKGDPERGRKTFELDANVPTVLIFGGSQGAKRINEAVMGSLEELTGKFNIIHICGTNNYEQLKEQISGKTLENPKRYRLYTFLSEEMKDAYAVSDLIVSRAGASSISEIIEVGKPSVIIPLSTAANGHQEKNAQWLSKAGIAKIISEKNLSSEILKNELFELLSDKSKTEEMRRNIVSYKEKVKENAAKAIAEIVLSYGTGIDDGRKE